jgi:hypothetical protein
MGFNRISAGRLYLVARALGEDVGYFFVGLESNAPNEPSPQQRMFLDLARNFRRIRTPKHQDAICSLSASSPMSRTSPTRKPGNPSSPNRSDPRRHMTGSRLRVGASAVCRRWVGSNSISGLRLSGARLTMKPGAGGTPRTEPWYRRSRASASRLSRSARISAWTSR